MMEVTLYGRKDCHLCEQAKDDLTGLRAQAPHRLTVVDIDSDDALQRRYGLEIPVVQVGPFTLKAPFTQQELLVTLLAALDRERHIEQIENSPKLEEVRQGQAWTGSDAFSLFLDRHYMALFNLMVFLYLGFAFLAPVLQKTGAETPATLLYKAYSMVCHQLGFRSFYLFGEQAYYPRAVAAQPGQITYAQASGLSEGSDAADLFAARNSPGNETMGYKVALCQRDVAIYGSILLFGLLFSVTGRRIPGLPVWAWLVFGVAPIALDGFSQLLSQPPLAFIPYRESTVYLRVLTGGLFGFCTAWFGYPLVEESMRDSREYLEAKRRRLMAR